MTQPYAAALFDLDGTLVDSNEQHVAVWEQVFREAGHPIDAATIRGQIGKGGDNLVPALIPGVDEALEKKLSGYHGALFKAEHLRGIRAFPGARELLRRVADAGLKVAFASSASQPELDHYVELLGARELIAAGTSSDDAESSKPDPDIFAAALDRVGVPAARALVVGDTPYDLTAARKGGIAGIALLSGGFDAGSLREAGAVAVYRDAAALLAGFEDSPLCPR